MKRVALAAALSSAAAAVFLAVATLAASRPFPPTLPPTNAERSVPRFLDRSGRPLNVTYRATWNVHDRVALHDVPSFLQEAFLAAEDKRFWKHGGADWLARASAVVQNVRALRAVRGASTITEQVVRMLHPRPRTVWSRWVEGFEAAALEKRFGKAQILEFYLNQVPYARERRGVRQAAREYFDRDLDTLNDKEAMALAVLVRSPSRLDPRRGTEAIEAPIGRLAARLLSPARAELLRREPLRLAASELDVDAVHFVGHVRERASGGGDVRTTLDASLQSRLQAILDRQIASLAEQGVGDGALLVVNHETDEVLAWVNGGGFGQNDGGQIDMVTAPRQPGSTLKPFLYALALEKGWTAATVLNDEPLVEAVGHGLHRFRNYSRRHYGPIRLREALGNSLNVPAVLAIRFTGREAFFDRLRSLGIDSLRRHPDFYGDGLALGNGEASLHEIVGAYATLARGGVYRPLRTRLEESAVAPPRRVFDSGLSSIVADILSDPDARALEFGQTSVLELPIQTAIKTGTSNDYRDAWIFGFSHRYTVGVWMGNVDRRPMRDVTGSVGPALVLRSTFAELHRNERSERLYLSRRVRAETVCRETGARAAGACPRATEWFSLESSPLDRCPVHEPAPRRATAGDDASASPPRVTQPSPGLHLALDPRIPDELERFRFELDRLPRGARVDWFVNGELVEPSRSEDGSASWPVRRGRHRVRARVVLSGTRALWTEPVGFLVK